VQSVIKNTVETDQEIEVLNEILSSLNNSLVLYNDDVNSFDHVIDCLVKYCKYNALQAEQMALIVHSVGKGVVKQGTLDELHPIWEALIDNQLSAVIE